MILWQGVGLFAFIPLVLWLLLAQPLGPGWSLALAVAIAAGHRAVAAPWAARRGRERCLWCGRRLNSAAHIAVASGPRVVVFGVCGPRHETLVRRFFGFVHGHQIAIALGIFAPLAVLVAGTFLRAVGVSLLAPELNTLQFRVVVAATVVLASIGYQRAPPAQAPRSAFPVHNLFLLGIRNTLWIFRIVGGWWLLAAAWHLWRLSRA